MNPFSSHPTPACNRGLPWSISVTQHSSSAPDGLWTLASITPLAPFRLTANDAGWFTFRPDSCSTTHTHTLNTSTPRPQSASTHQRLSLNANAPLKQGRGPEATFLTLRSLAGLKRGGLVERESLRSRFKHSQETMDKYAKFLCVYVVTAC